MARSVLDAIKSGIWDYEPATGVEKDFDPTEALPGSDRKLEILSERLLSGKPLWHPADRLYHGEKTEEE